MAKKIVGILGGMGPEATVDFMSKIIKMTPAKTDQEHIRMLIDNNPQVPDRTKAILDNGENPSSVLAEMAENLEKWGAEFLAMPCNTAHYYLDEIIKTVKIPIINMIAETGKVLAADKIENAGLLATTGTLKTRLYQKTLDQLGIKVIIPSLEYQEKVMQIIYAVKSGEHENLSALKKEVIDHMQEKGAAAIILGCTELPIAFNNQNQFSLNFYDPTEILAQAVIEVALS